MDLSQIEHIVKSIRSYYPVSDASIRALATHLTAHRFPKNHLLTTAGRRDRNAYFIEQGCTRTYFMIDGKEVTNWFSTEGDVTFSSNSLYHQTPGFENVQVMEDALIYAIPIRELNKLYETNIEIANWGRVIHQEVLLRMQTLRIERLSLTAKERYERFITDNPGLINRVNLGFIASYLGMSQPHLSTLRAETRF